MTGTDHDPRVPAYLGRVLDGNGEPGGTCFEVEPGVLVTAWHVLDDIGCGDIGAVVDVDGLSGQPALGATVVETDPVHDLAVLRATTDLPTDTAAPANTPDPVTGSLGEAISGFGSTDAVDLGDGIVVTGVAEIADPGHTYRHLDAPGHWAGTTTRDSIPLGRLRAPDIVPGMSGAPVCHRDSGLVVGVVAARFNTVDGWLVHSVLVVRTEDLEPLLRNVGVDLPVARAVEPVDLRLTIDERRVEVRGRGVSAQGDHRGVPGLLVDRVNDLRRARASVTARTIVDDDTTAGASTVSEVGHLLGRSFLPDGVAAAVADVVKAAETAHQRVRLGVEAGDLSALPWEVMPEPGGGRPLALSPVVDVYRHHDATRPRDIPGPLRIVVAIASPLEGGGELLDYGRELRNILAAFRGARHHDARVRIVPFATTDAIREALAAEPAHVLHLTGHGTPGRLILERADGKARPVDADTFVEEAIPPGAMPPLVTLAACYTDVADDPAGLSFAEELMARGAAAVVATEASVTDIYATRLLARVYNGLASAATPEVVAAVCDARRQVQRELDRSDDEIEKQLAALEEWSTVTVLAAGPTLLTFGDDEVGPLTAPTHRRAIGEVLAREAGDFVGRRREQRFWPGELLEPSCSGKVLHGIGGVGKTTLAAELARRVIEIEPHRVTIGLSGEVGVERLLGQIATALRVPAIQRGDQAIMPVLDVLARPDLGWDTRTDVLVDHVLTSQPMLVILDNFEDNLTQPAGNGGDGGGDAGPSTGDGDDGEARTVTDDGLARLLARWVQRPGRSRLLVTSRHPFLLPGDAQGALEHHQVGPLSLPETRMLMWALPALDRLDADQASQVWRLLGGHPRSLEYLDALLGRGGRFPDVTVRIRRALADRVGAARAGELLDGRTDFDVALAETVALAADDVLLADLLTELDRTPGARDLVNAVSVYRRSVDLNGVLFQVGTADEGAAHVPDREAAVSAIGEVLADAGVEVDPGSGLDPSALAPEVLGRLLPHLAELQALPRPPMVAPDGLDRLIEVGRGSSLLTAVEVDDDTPPRYSIHRWTADELARRLPAEELRRAHQAAAAYWRWRVDVWPQGTEADVADLLEARHHLVEIGDLDEANTLTEHICTVLDRIGAWDQEEALILETRDLLPDDHPRQAVWIHQLGILAQARGDYEQAETRYQQALTIFERLGNQASMAASYHQLGILAQHRGDYEQAETRYQQALTIFERLGNQAGMATSYHQLGTLAQHRGDYEQAETRYQQSLTINERLGNQANMANSYHQLGTLAQHRGDYEQAETRYQQALTIFERLGNQAGMATSYGQLGILAQDRGDYEQAETRYQQSLTIEERLGNQAGMATSYHQLGTLAQHRGDYEQAETRYQQSLTIEERLGNQAGMATSYHQLGTLAQHRGDYEQAETRYQQALTIKERLGNQAGMATSWSAFGELEVARDRPDRAVQLHTRALAVRLRIGVPQAAIDLRALVALRGALGRDEFDRHAREAGDQDSLGQLHQLLDRFESEP